jgi:PAS domain S-box-containing protein
VRDTGADARIQPNAGYLRALQIKALLNVPLLEQGRLVAVWFVHDTAARSWTDREVAFLQTVADRAWAAMAQARAVADLRQLNETLETEVALRTRERDQAWKNSQDLQAVVAPDGRFRAINTAWTTILGWRPEEVVGTSHLDFLHPDDYDASLAALAILSTRPLPPFENRYRDRGGAYHWISWVAATESGLIYASGRHVTAEKQAAIAMQAVEGQLRQSQKMEAVGQLTGGLAHDFNNLLTSISGSLELLQLRIAEGRFSDIDPYINAAHNSARRAAALTHRLLAFSRQQTLEPKQINVNLLVAEMQGLLAMTVGSAVKTEVTGDPDLWTTLVDPNQLENVLLNLVINARDAMPGGGILTISTRNLPDAETPRICISVTDTGTGMPADVIERAFDPFYTTKPIGQGTGLGLSMVYGFMRQSGGQAKIISAVGQGTTVQLFLPRYAGELCPAQPGAPAAAPAPEPAGGGAVLVLEDEPIVRAIVVEVLEELGYTAIEAADGPAGLEILNSSRRIDLLITDIGLPGLNGRQVAEAARQTRTNLKILFMTGYAETAAMADGFLQPGMQMITKPFAIDNLASRITAIIESTPEPS